MSTITKRPVTLTVDETQTLLGILRNYSSERWEHARRTKSPSVREYCQDEGRKASDLEADIVRRIYAEPFDADAHSVRCTSEQCDCG